MNPKTILRLSRAVQRSTLLVVMALTAASISSQAWGVAYFVNDLSTAGDVYTSAIGAPGNDGLTASTPKLTMTNLLATYTLAAGDVVYIDTGTYSNYTVTVTSSGTATNPIVFLGSTNFAAGGTEFRRNSAGADAWSMSSVNYVHLKNLTLRGARDGLFLSQGKDLLIERVTARNNSRYGMFFSVFSDRSVVQNSISAFNSDYQVFVQNSSNVLINSSVAWGNFGVYYQQSFGGAMFVSNSVIRATGSGNSVFRRGGEIISDHNLYFAENNAVISTTSSTISDSLPRLSDWQGAYNTDWRSTSVDPLFADAANLDFHPRSENGRYTGPGTFTNDTVTSPLIDMGAPNAAFSNETANNGGRLNVGAYGNTAEASRSSTNRSLIALTYSDGGVLTGTGSLYWAGGNLQSGDKVTAEYSFNGGATWSVIATNLPATNGVVVWNSTGAGSSGAAKWRVRIESPGPTNVIGANNGLFSVRNANLAFYVNDSSTSGDQYASAIGNATNLGTSAATPKDSLERVLAFHTLSGGDFVYIDTGTYNVTNTIVMNYRHRGTNGNPVIISGPTNVLVGGAVLDRNNTASDVVSLSSAPFITFRHLDIRRGNNAITFSQSVNGNVENCVLRQNQVNGVDFQPGSHNGTVRNTLIANNVTRSFTVAATNVSVVNCTIYATKGVFVSSGGTLRFENNVARSSGSGNAVFESLSGFSSLVASDGYNLYFFESGAALAKVGVITYQMLTDWQKASGRDWRSTVANPEFADPGNYDFHPRSQTGRWEGSGFVTDSVTSVSIDLGNPADAFSNELAPNGNRVNAGGFGNTPEASKSRTNAWLAALTYQDGGTLNVPTDSIYWNYGGLPTGATVRIELSSDGGANWSTVATNINATLGTYLWANTNFNSSRFARWRVVYENDPTVVGSISSNIVLRNGPFIYYLNDSSTAGDVYTTAVGSDTNIGTSASGPKATLKSLLDDHLIASGDIIYADTGVYTFSANQEVSILDTGDTNDFVYLRGSTNIAAGGTAFRRNFSTGSSFALYLNGASYWSISDITFRDSNYGLYLFNATGTRVQGVRAFNNSSMGIYVSGSASTGIRIRNSSSYRNLLQGVMVDANARATLDNLVLWRNDVAGLRVDSGFASLSNSIIVADGTLATAYQVATLTNVFADYNNILVRTQAVVATVSQQSLLLDSIGAWSAVSGQDRYSFGEEPLFANPGSGDFHLKSEASEGRFQPGVGFVLDSESSRLIDAGNPTFAFTNEPAPNGSRINIGAFGNTWEASKRITNAALFAATHRQGGLATGTSILHWIAYNLPSSHLVRVSYSPNGGSTWTTLATGLAATAEAYAWNTLAYSNTPAALWRIASESDTNLVDTTATFFSLRNSPLSLYINDSSLSGDVYTTGPGRSTNWVATAQQPLNSLSLAIQRYNLEPGDTLYLDTGFYSVQPQVIGRQWAGSTNVAVVINGSTNFAAGGSILEGPGLNINDRVLTLSYTRGITISNLTIRNGRTGLFLDNTPGVTLAFLTAKANSNGVVLSQSGNISIQRSAILNNLGIGVWNIGTAPTNAIDNSILLNNSIASVVQTAGRLDVNNSVLSANGPNAYVYQVLSNSTLKSDYNNIITSNGASVALSSVSISKTLSRWQALLTNDFRTLSHEPYFANPGAGDFHIKSPAGRFDPSVNGFITSDTDRSPMIDAGNPASPFANESAPNGGRMNIGMYGNHPQASRSPTNGWFYTLSLNDGGSARGTNTLYWLSGGTATGLLVYLDYSADGGINWTNIATNISASAGSYAWNTMPYESSAKGLWRIVGVTDGSVAATNQIFFSLNNAPLAYYVNDGDQEGDVYTTNPGIPENDGLTAATPVNSIQTLVTRYSLQPGDRILVDTGRYILTNAVTIDISRYVGVATNPLSIIGSTNITAGGTQISRRNGAVAFDLNSVAGVNLSYLTVSNAGAAVRIRSSTNALVQWLDIKGTGIGIELIGSRDTTIRHTAIRECTTNALAVLQSTNTIVQNSVLWSNVNAVLVGLPFPPIVSGPDSSISISNSALAAFGSSAILYRLEGGSIQGDFNNIELNNGAVMSRQTGGFFARIVDTLALWRQLTGQDFSSLSVAAQFASPEEGDFHLRSQNGRFNIQSQSFVNDGETSRLIDAGAPTAAFTNEPAPNGGRINIGRYGNTAEASRMPTNGTLTIISNNDGGNVSGTNVIRWVATGRATGDIMRIDLSLDGGATFTNLTTNFPSSSGQYSWNTLDHTSTVRGVIRFFNQTTTNVMDSTDKLFSIRNHPIVFYVNDGSMTGDVYTTTSGVSFATGLTRSEPKRSLAEVLSSWDVEPNDIIYIDTGLYTNAVVTTFGQLDGGSYTSSASVLVQGSTNIAAGGSRFTGPTAGTTLYVTDAAGINFRNLTFSGATLPVLIRRSESITFQNVEISGGHTGLRADGARNIELVNSSIRNAATFGLAVFGVSNITWQSGVLWSNPAAVFITSSTNYVGFSAQPNIVNVSNSVLAVFGSTAYAFDARELGTVLHSDYNNIRRINGAFVGTTRSTNSSIPIVYNSVKAWSTLRGNDLNSQSLLDPLFNSPETGDFRPKSAAGRYDPATGLFVNDAVTSPLIDAGAPSAVYTNETAPNGERINIGAHGNSFQASRSPTNSSLYVLSFNDGGTATGANERITWSVAGNATGHTVSIEVSVDGGVTWTNLATNLSATAGSYTWNTFNQISTPAALIRISSEQEPSVSKITAEYFSIRNSPLVYYVNDFTTSGDIYTTAIGNSTNLGISVTAPVDTLPRVLDRWTLGPGDLVYVDTGYYTNSSEILINQFDAGGFSNVLKVTIQGSTNYASGGTVIHRDGGNGLNINEAGGVVVKDLRFTGASTGVRINETEGVEIERVEVDGAATGFDVLNSSNLRMDRNVARNISSRGVSFSGCDGVDWRSGVLWSNKIGMRLSGSLRVSVSNSVFGIFGSASQAYAIESALPATFSSDYNNYYLTQGAILGTQEASFNYTYATVADWSRRVGRDLYSLSHDPLFADPGAGDFHLKSRGGRFSDALNGFVTDAETSPLIDAGNPVESFSVEPSPNGRRRNIGLFGNSGQASRTPTNSALFVVSLHDGGRMEGIKDLIWTAQGNVTSGTVRLEYSSDNGISWVSIVSNVAASASRYTWDSRPYASSLLGYWRIASEQEPTVSSTNTVRFALRNTGLKYYVNDGSTLGDVYCTGIGSATNIGVYPSAPINGIQPLFDYWNIEPGDTIYVDTGNYLITTPLSFEAEDAWDDLATLNVLAAGLTTNRVHLLGSTNDAFGGSLVALFGAGNVMNVNSAPGLKISNFTLQGGNIGVRVNSSPYTQIEWMRRSGGTISYELNTSPNSSFRHNVARQASQRGLSVVNSTNTLWQNGIMWSNPVSFFQDGGIFSISGLQIENSIVGAFGSNSVVHFNQSGSRSSDYNNFYLVGGAQAATILTPGSVVSTRYETVSFYTKGTGQDAHTLTVDPKFANLNAGDYHLKTTTPGGRFDPVSGLWTNDTEFSRLIDAGNPTSTFSQEPAENGGRRNIGLYGGTGQASKTPTNGWFTTISLNDNGSVQGTVTLNWHAGGSASNELVSIDFSPVGGITWTNIATNVLASLGTLEWDTSTFGKSAAGKWRIISQSSTSLYYVIDGFITMRDNTGVIPYFVNDSSLAGDVYCTAVGSPFNNGLLPSTPMSSVQQVFDTYKLEPVDIVYIDTGLYLLANEISIGELDSGGTTNRITIQGSTNYAAGGTILDRQVVQAGTVALRMENITGYNLRDLILRGGTDGLRLERVEDLDLYRVNAQLNGLNGISIKDSQRVTIGNSIMRRNGNATNGVGLSLDFATVTMRNSAVWDNFRGVQVSQSSLDVRNSVLNSVFDGGQIYYLDALTTEGAVVGDYNNYISQSGGRLAEKVKDSGGNNNYAYLQDWIRFTSNETNSLAHSPYFTDSTNGVFSLLSQAGRFEANGTLVTNDTLTSPMIDTGDPDSAFTNEVEPNGGRINMGVYGNTSFASLSRTNPWVLAIAFNDGGVAAGVTRLNWAYGNLSPTAKMRLEFSRNAGAEWFVLASNINVSAGSLDWNAGSEQVTTLARWRILSETETNVFDEIDNNFAIKNNTLTIFVNDGGTNDDVYCTSAGLDTNSGLSNNVPLLSVRDAFTRYPLGPGDIIYIDSGFYSVSNTLVLNEFTRGSSGMPIRVQGSTNLSQATTLQFNNNLYGLRIANSKFIDVSDLSIRGATNGVLVNFSEDVNIDRVNVHNNLRSGFTLENVQRVVIRNSTSYRNTGWGLQASASSLSVLNGVIYSNSSGSVKLENSNLQMLNSIVHAANASSYVYQVSESSLAGCDYNFIWLVSTNPILARDARFGFDYLKLREWQKNTGADVHSVLLDPQMVNPTAGDFSLRSKAGRFDTNGVLVTSDSITSWAIDAGRPGDAFANETAPNGSRVNVGSHGNLAIASRSLTNPADRALLVSSFNDGGTANGLVTLYWLARGFSPTSSVRVEYSLNNGLVWQVAATNQAAVGSGYLWDTSELLSSPLVRWRVISEENTNIVDEIDRSFILRNGPILYYVNDTNQNGDVWTANPGNITNDALSIFSPQLDINRVLEDYDLEEGDSIFVDAGLYAINREVYFGSLDNGSSTSRVQILGSPVAGATVFTPTLAYQTNGVAPLVGLHLVNARNVQIEDITIDGFDQGMLFELFARDNLIQDVIIKNGGGDGIYLNLSDDNLFNRMVIARRGGSGLRADVAIGNMIQNSVIWSNGLSALDLGRSVLSVTNSILGAYSTNYIYLLRTNAMVEGDYNAFYIEEPAAFAQLDNLTYEHVPEWVFATEHEFYSLETDPLFNDSANHDYHLKSSQGRYDPFYGYYVFTDTNVSPLIDSGPRDWDFGDEPAPNGARINIGLQANTAKASLSRTNAWLETITGMGGGRLEGTLLLTWSYNNISETEPVVLDYSYDNGSTWINIGTGLVSELTYLWQSDQKIPVDVERWASSPIGRWRLALANNTNIYDITDTYFSLRNKKFVFYLNDESTVGDIYTTGAGSDTNLGIFIYAPKKSLQSLLDVLDVEGDDTIVFDTGVYPVSTNANWTLEAADQGKPSLPVIIRGSTNSPYSVITRDGPGTGPLLTLNGKYVLLTDLIFQSGGLVAKDNVTLTSLVFTNSGTVAINGVEAQISNSKLYLSSLSMDSANSQVTSLEIQHGGISVVGTNVYVRNNLIYGTNNSAAVTVNGVNIVVENNTLATKGSAFYQDGFGGSTLRNNILAADGANRFCIDATSGTLISDYNNLYVRNGAWLGGYRNGNWEHLIYWQREAGQDQNSIASDPQFNNEAAGDFRLKSKVGRWNGLTFVNDATHSPSIDAGSPVSEFTGEPSPNGLRINQGFDGNTALASMSLTNAWLTALTMNDGGVFKGTNLIAWRAGNVTTSDLVRLEYSADNGTTWTTIVSGVSAGQTNYLWNSTTMPSSLNARWRVVLISDTNILDATDNSFSLRNTALQFFVNDSATTGDVYTTAVGNDSNNGLTVSTPKRTMQALLAAYDTEGGDIVYIDTGSYNISSLNQVIWSRGGDAVNGPVVIQGSTNIVAGGTQLRRTVLNVGNHVVEVPASYVTLRDLTLENGFYGIYASSNLAFKAERILVRSNEYAMLLNTTFNTDLRNISVYGSNQGGIDVINTRTTRMENMTFAANPNFMIRLNNTVNDTLQNNIFYVSYSNTTVYAGATNSIYTANIDYNVYYFAQPTSFIYGTYRTLLPWQIDRQKDYRSAITNPLLNNASGGDFHLQSASGRFSPVTGTWTNDALSSWAIDRSNPATDYSNEPAVNGARANLGAFGNTIYASKSTTNTVLETRILNDATVIDDNTPTNIIPLIWGSIKLPTNLLVDVQYSGDGGDSWQTLQAGVSAYQEYIIWQATPNFNTYKGEWRVVGTDGTNTFSATNSPEFTVFFGEFEITREFRGVSQLNNFIFRGAWDEWYQVQYTTNGFTWTNAASGAGTNQTALFLTTRGGDFTFEDVGSTTSQNFRSYRVLWLQGYEGGGGGGSIDADSDGIPDAWESGNGLNSSTNDAYQDPDGDTLFNIEEYISGTDPQGSNSFAEVAAFSPATLFAIQVPSVTGRLYTLESASTLSGGSVWSNEPGQVDVAGLGSTLSLTNDRSAPVKFYRVRIRMAP